MREASATPRTGFGCPKLRCRDDDCNELKIFAKLWIFDLQQEPAVQHAQEPFFAFIVVET